MCVIFPRTLVSIVHLFDFEIRSCELQHTFILPYEIDLLPSASLESTAPFFNGQISSLSSGNFLIFYSQLRLHIIVIILLVITRSPSHSLSVGDTRRLSLCSCVYQIEYFTNNF